jgi:hypothetical protein
MTLVWPKVITLSGFYVHILVSFDMELCQHNMATKKKVKILKVFRDFHSMSLVNILML